MRSRPRPERVVDVQRLDAVAAKPVVEHSAAPMVSQMRQLNNRCAVVVGVVAAKEMLVIINKKAAARCRPPRDAAVRREAVVARAKKELVVNKRVAVDGRAGAVKTEDPPAATGHPAPIKPGRSSRLHRSNSKPNLMEDEDEDKNNE